jgi:hypothetical protein
MKDEDKVKLEQYFKEDPYWIEKSREMYIDKVFEDSTAIQNVHTPESLCSEVVGKLKENCELSGRKILILNPEFATILGNEDITFLSDCPKKSRYVKGFYPNIKVIEADFLKWESEMKTFDVCVMNPPYHSQSDASDTNTQALWHKFVAKAIDVVKEDGFLVAIHPSGWRNVAGAYKDTQALLKSKSMKYLKLHSFRDGQLVFNVAINFDYYILQNTNNKKCLTNILFEDGVEQKIDISKLEFIPSENFNEIMSLVAKDGEEKVEILGNCSYHTQKDYMARENKGEYKYPCVYTVKSPDKGNIPTFYFSTLNTKGHFGIPKVIFAGGASGVYIDSNAEYGLTQFAYAIVDQPKNLENIKKALQSERFIRKIMGFKFSLGDKYNRKIIATFRKDFWKEFV